MQMYQSSFKLHQTSVKTTFSVFQCRQSHTTVGHIPCCCEQSLHYLLTKANYICLAALKLLITGM